MRIEGKHSARRVEVLERKSFPQLLFVCIGCQQVDIRKRNIGNKNEERVLLH